MSEMPLESPPEGVAAQRTGAYPDRTSRTAVRDDAELPLGVDPADAAERADDLLPGGVELPFEADPADVAEQAAELALDEDDYQ
jgi:hypothetical protein